MQSRLRLRSFVVFYIFFYVNFRIIKLSIQINARTIGLVFDLFPIALTFQAFIEYIIIISLFICFKNNEYLFLLLTFRTFIVSNGCSVNIHIVYCGCIFRVLNEYCYKFEVTFWTK